MRKIVLSLFSLFLLVLSSCGSLWEKPVFRIGIDPEFYSLELDGMEGNVYAYCNELFKLIAKKEGIDIAFVKTSWDILERGMETGQYHAIISARPKYVEMKNLFDHSSLFLATGPDLVVEKTFNASSLVDLNNKVVAIVSESKNDLLLEGNPHITIHAYPSMATALTSITAGYSDAALIPNLFAQHYVHNLYNNALKIVGPPLTDAGLRLITEHKKNQNLLDLVNNALSSLREDGKLQDLQKKWNLSYEE